MEKELLDVYIKPGPDCVKHIEVLKKFSLQLKIWEWIKIEDIWYFAYFMKVKLTIINQMPYKGLKDLFLWILKIKHK